MEERHIEGVKVPGSIPGAGIHFFDITPFHEKSISDGRKRDTSGAHTTTKAYQFVSVGS